MTVDAARAKSIFLAASELPNLAERADYLVQQCGSDGPLRVRVEALLRAHYAAADLGNEPSGPGYDPTIITPVSEHPGTIIAGRYKLLEAIGEGGMGSVWVAEQSQPVKRKVALKLIKAGMDSKSVLARFEAERQALAVMDHPNIAKVLDGGLTEQGRPYFVMEYVKGIPITEYCDSRQLSVPERLQLFAQVCQAVQHAHQKGIIHRDLKPSNILVAPYDDKPVPKVIDFGLAKAIHQSLTENTLHTAHDQVLGTPLYMSPEQAQLNNIDIDTRSDIYSLGVLLYELLTGSTPLEKQRFKQAAWDEMRRMIREEDPPRPSLRLSSAETLPSVAAGRHTEPASLTKLVRGELDWIVMKALEKDRTRRYETANGFAADVLRYLAGEPVTAAPPSTMYRFQKFVRRNKGKVIASCLVLLALLSGMAGTSWQWSRAERALLAEAERAEGERLAKLDAVAQAEQAQKRLAQIEKANDILGSIFENLDPKEIVKAERPLQAILVEKLDEAVALLEGESIGDPLVVAAMQNKFGVSLLGLGEPGKAIVLLEKARTTYQAKLGPNHLDTLHAMNVLAAAYQRAGKLDLALPLHEETLKLTKASLGPEHPLTLTSMANLALTYNVAGKLDLALPLHEETLKLTKAKHGPEHPTTLSRMSNLARAYHAVGKQDLALQLFGESLKLRKATLGPEHPDTLTSMDSLAVTYLGAGKLDLALPLHEETLKIRKAKLGPEHPDTLATMSNLAGAYKAAGTLELALPLFEETLKLRKATLGPEHPDTLTSMNNLALAYRDAGKLDLSLPLYEETLKLRKATLGPEHPDTLASMNKLALAYKVGGKLDLAQPLYEETLKFRQAKLGSEHPDTLISMRGLAEVYKAAGKPDLALPLYEETLKLRKATLGPEHSSTITSMANLVAAYNDANQGEKATETLREFIAGQGQRANPDDPRFALGLAQGSLALLKCRQYAAAEELLRECLTIREKTQHDDWSTFNTKSMLGEALLGQKKYADAEPQLLAGYEGLKQRETTIPEQGKIRLPEALERLVQLYTGWHAAEPEQGYDAKTAEWQTKLEDYKAATTTPSATSKPEPGK